MYATAATKLGGTIEVKAVPITSLRGKSVMMAMAAVNKPPPPIPIKPDVNPIELPASANGSVLSEMKFVVLLCDSAAAVCEDGTNSSFAVRR